MTFYEKLMASVLVDGALIVPGVTELEMRKLHEALRKDLLEYNIPHTRIIGVGTESHTSDCASIVRVISQIGLTMAEVLNGSKDLVYDILPYEPIGIGGVLSSNVAKLLISTALGSRPGDVKIPKQPNKHVRALDETVLVAPVVSSSSLGTLEVALYRGKGYCDLFKIQTLISPSKFNPIPVLFDLTGFIGLQPYNGDASVVFVYKKNIREEVLQQILHDYFKEGAGKWGQE